MIEKKNLAPFITSQADLEVKDKQGLTITDIPMNGIFAATPCNYFGHNSLHQAAWSKRFDQTLSEKSIKEQLSQPDKFGRTPLFYLIRSTNLTILESLKPYLDKEIVNITNLNKKTALFYAAFVADVHIFQFLLACDADPDLADQNDITPRQIAERYNRQEILAQCMPQQMPLTFSSKRSRKEIDTTQTQSLDTQEKISSPSKKKYSLT